MKTYLVQEQVNGEWITVVDDDDRQPIIFASKKHARKAIKTLNIEKWRIVDINGKLVELSVLKIEDIL